MGSSEFLNYPLHPHSERNFRKSILSLVHLKLLLCPGGKGVIYSSWLRGVNFPVKHPRYSILYSLVPNLFSSGLGYSFGPFWSATLPEIGYRYFS